ILDCIDNVKVKAAMAAVCKKRKQFMVACGAAGGKTSAMNIIHEDLARTTGDPLLSRMRYDLRKKYGFPKLKAGKRVEKFGIPCVYTADPVKRPEGVCDVGTGLSCAGYGSSVVVTAALGLAAASVAINHITGTDSK
ncbi:tRNA threonylcarbamoyladenosine dehydratase, partial [Turicibacter sanguinis]|nr:tRNA threonylcarbamoyladenosine dehydratase [Turicibacter sanguinis]